MPRPVWWWLFLGLCSLLEDQAEAPSPVEPPERSRPYAVLRGQNLGASPPPGGLQRPQSGPGPAWRWGLPVPSSTTREHDGWAWESLALHLGMKKGAAAPAAYIRSAVPPPRGTGDTVLACSP
ncbi:hypothetical protein MC885_013630 [Smutsia gigantea]|nr:hypothetical protein MC885_013630 [Smutsia gigantea]